MNQRSLFGSLAAMMSALGQTRRDLAIATGLTKSRRPPGWGTSRHTAHRAAAKRRTRLWMAKESRRRNRSPRRHQG